MTRFATFVVLSLTLSVTQWSLPASLVSTAVAELPSDSSIHFVPSDAAFYSSSLQIGKQLKAFTSSRAYRKLTSLPVVQMGLTKLEEEWRDDGDLAPMRAFFEQDENKPILQLLNDCYAQEIFLYGDGGYASWLGALGALGNTINMASMQAATQGEDPDEAIQRAMLDMLNDPNLTQVPSTVIGFRLSDKATAETQLKRLEGLVSQLIATEAKPLEGRFSRKTFGDGNYLSLQLDGSLVPWDEALEDAEMSDENKDRLAAKLSKVTINVNLGTYKQYLILAIGKDDTPVQQLGTASTLIDSREAEPLKQHFSKDVYGIGIVSGEMLRQISSVDRQMDQLSEMFKAVLPMIPMISPDVKADLETDVAALFQEIKQLQPRVDSVSAVSFAVPGGHDTMTYNWSEAKSLDCSKPLTITSHLGGDPIAFFATRMKSDPAQSAFAKRWGSKVGEYFERIALPIFDEDQLELYKVVKAKMMPLVDRLKTANKDLLEPAFEDGQFAFVMDAQVSREQWHGSMPRADQPVPLPEFSMVWGLSDAEKLKQGAAEYFAVAQDTINAMNEIMPEQVPALPLPRPRVKDLSENGKVYRYMIPAFLGLDPDIAPNAGVANDALVLSLTPVGTRRLLTPSKLVADSLLASPDSEQMGSAWEFKMNRVVQMVRPWVSYGFQMAAEEGVQDPEVASQVTAVLDVLECIRTSSGYSFRKNGMVVSHSRMQYKDLSE